MRRALERWEAAQATGAPQLTEEELHTLDVLRDDDPELAVRKAKSALKSAERARLPRLLAVYGSARRSQTRLDEAREALLAALDLAERGGDRVLAADVLQRLGEAARETTKAMASLLRYLEGNRLVGAVLMQLVSIAFAGRQLSERLLDQAAQKIREERARRGRRARLGT